MAATTAPRAAPWARVVSAVPADTRVARAVHVFVLSAVAIAQPLWSLLVANAEFLVARRADRAEILLTALLVLVVPPLVVLAVEAGAALVSSRLAAVLHALAVGGFALLVFLRVLVRLLGGHAAGVFALAALGAAGALAYYLTTTGVRRALTAAGPAPFVFLAMFVLSADVRPLVFTPARGPGLTVSFGTRPPVVFLVFDEFPLRGLLTRDLEIDAARVPNFARFAATSTWYRRATTVHEVSEMAVPALLAGIRSERKHVPTAQNFPVNLFSIFTAGGYDVRADEVLTRLCTEETCAETPDPPPLPLRVRSHLKDLGVVYGHQVLPPSVATRALPDIGLTWGGFRAAGDDTAADVGPAGVRSDLREDQQARLEEFLSGLRPSARPTLHYGHLLMPHAPFNRLPNGKRYTRGNSFIGLDFKTGYWPDDEFVTDQAEQRNLLQIGYTDLQFGRVLDRLERTGLFDDALVVVASDHGSTNRPGFNRRAFEEETLGDLGPVPLLVKLPGQRTGAVDDVPAETIDVLPTLADLLGFAIPGPVTGQSLLDPVRARTERLLVDQFGEVFRATAEFPQLRESVEHMYSRFAHDGDHLNLYATGPYRSVVGRRVSELPARAGTLRATLNNPEYWTTPAGAPGQLSPAHQTGVLHGRPAASPPGSPVHLAIAVGDLVVATSRSFEVRGDTARIDMIVPDEQLQPGHAEVRLFALSGPPERPALTPVALG